VEFGSRGWAFEVGFLEVPVVKTFCKDAGHLPLSNCESYQSGSRSRPAFLELRQYYRESGTVEVQILFAPS
jgi:hypothetical protein